MWDRWSCLEQTWLPYFLKSFHQIDRSKWSLIKIKIVNFSFSYDMISSKRVAMATVQKVSLMYISGAKFEEHCFFILYLVFYHFSCTVITFLIRIIQKTLIQLLNEKWFSKKENTTLQHFERPFKYAETFSCNIHFKNCFDVRTSMIWTLFVLMFTTYTVVQCIVAGEAYLKPKNPYNQWQPHHKPWPGSLWCDLRQDTILSQHYQFTQS